MLNLKDKLFTNREKIVKGIKFRLEPTESTQKTITELNLIDADIKLKEKAEKFKVLYDEYIRCISNLTLEHLSFDFTALGIAYSGTKEPGLERDEKMKRIRDYDRAKNELLAAISGKVAELLPKSIKSTADISAAGFLSEELTDFLEKKSSLDEDTKNELREILKEGTTGFTVILRRFLNTRITALNVWMPQRVVENLEIYCDNIPALRRFLDTDDGKDFLCDYPETDLCCDPAYYRFCMSQPQIDAYNRFISGDYNENGIQKKGYNQLVTELNSIHRADRNYEGPFFRKVTRLSKQVLMPSESQFSISRIENDDEARQELAMLSGSVSMKDLYVTVAALRSAPREGIITGSLHEFSHVATGDHGTISEEVIRNLSSGIEEEIGKTDNSREGKKQRRELEEKLNGIERMVRRSTFTVAELEQLCSRKGLADGLVLRLNEDLAGISEALSGLDSAAVFSDTTKLHNNNNSMAAIKKYLDALIAFRTDFLIVKPMGDQRADAEFYNRLDDMLSMLGELTGVYNRMRNYLTSRPGDIAQEEICTFGSASKLEPSWYNGDSDRLVQPTLINKVFYLTPNICYNRLTSEREEVYYAEYS